MDDKKFKIITLTAKGALAAATVAAAFFLWSVNHALSPSGLCKETLLSDSKVSEAIDAKLIERDCGATSRLSRSLLLSSTEDIIILRVDVLGSGLFDYCIKYPSVLVSTNEVVKVYRTYNVNLDVFISPYHKLACR